MGSVSIYVEEQVLIEQFWTACVVLLPVIFTEFKV